MVALAVGIALAFHGAAKSLSPAHTSLAVQDLHHGKMMKPKPAVPKKIKHAPSDPSVFASRKTGYT